MTETRYATTWWTSLDDGRIRCDVCPRACALHDGQAGLCFVRMRAGDRIVLTTYGRSSGFCVDPIEKKPLNHFLPGTSVLSFGTAGCNLACRFCQNWDISKSREIDTLAETATLEQIAEAAVRLGSRSVAFTYNDPVIFMEYATDVADACRERGLKAVAVTAGYMNAGPRAEFYRHMDAANVDLKAFTDDFLSQHLRRPAGARAGDARVPQARHRSVVRDHESHDPRTERRAAGDRRDDTLDRRSPWARRPGPLHCVPSGLEAPGSAAHAGGDSHGRPRHRLGQRPPLRLHRQYPRRRG